MNIKQKLLTGFGALVFIISAFGIYVYEGINTFDEISDKKAASYEQLVGLKHITNINTSMKLESMDLIRHKYTGVVSSKYTNTINQLFKDMFEFEKKIKKESKGRKEKLDLIKKLMSEYRIFEKTLKKDLPNLIINIQDVSLRDFKKMSIFIDEFRNNAAKDIYKLKKIIEKDLKIAINNEDMFADKIKLIIILMIIGSIILALTIGLYITNNNTKAVNNFQKGLLDFFKYLNREIDEVKLLDDSSKDEIGSMAKVVNENISITKSGIEEDREFLNEAIKVLSEFEQGDLCQRIKVSVKNPALMELKKVLDSMGDQMENNINNILSILKQYSNYNYMNKVDNSNVKNQLFDLANGVNCLGNSITSMLLENKKVGLSLNSSSETLLQNVQVLNDSSNSAAASLEETAAALEEITGTIISNTENITEMAEFANKVIKSVEEGNILANQTTKSMEEINEQVTAINDSIGVIDQIAFQTNILSLNAAVEAATAGEAGKGFAVVAQEVRNLASRSAEAAKEIKELVENANSKTNDGKIISDKMIHGYTSLNENIKKTIDLIKHVEVASKEQQAGIEQINDALTAQDQQTQKIASAANDTNAIAVHASTIAEQIVQAVDSKEFKGKDLK